jgi:hypothetical protein
MSDLAKYEGNFIKYADSLEFDNGEARSFSNISELDLNVSCDVAIFPAQDARQTIVEIDSETPEKFKVYEDDGAIVIEEEQSSSNSVVINSFGGGRSVSVVSGGNVMMVNGEVWVNGKKVDPDQNSSSPAQRPSRVRIYAHSGIALQANLSGVSVLASKVVFRRANVKINGQSTVGFAAEKIDIKLSGQGKSYVICQGGGLDVKVSGQGSIVVKGEYSEVEASVSGMGSVSTNGACNGNYSADLSGMGRISHNGVVKGRVRKNKSGMGQITGL